MKKLLIIGFIIFAAIILGPIVLARTARVSATNVSPASLRTVKFDANLELLFYVSGSKIFYGDGAEENLTAGSNCYATAGPSECWIAQHTYAEPGGYEARVVFLWLGIEWPVVNLMSVTVE